MVSIHIQFHCSLLKMEKNKVFSKKISQKLYITMFHGKKDEVVPLSFSRKVLSIF